MLIRFGAFTLDGDRRQLFRDGAPLHVTPKAFELFTLLVTHAPRVVNKEELHRQLWPGTFISDATLSGLIKELRRVLDDRSPAAPIIRTAHRVGYAFCPPIEPVIARDAAPRHWLVLRRRRVPLRPGENIIGRDIASDVHLDDVSVSRRHARVLIENGLVRLEDLNSKTGRLSVANPLAARLLCTATNVWRSAQSPPSIAVRIPACPPKLGAAAVLTPGAAEDASHDREPGRSRRCLSDHGTDRRRWNGRGLPRT